MHSTTCEPTCRPSSSRSDTRCGSTIIEVLGTVLILTAIFVGIYSTQGSLMRMNSLSGGLGEATALAQEKVEELMALPVAGVVGGSDTNGVYSRTWTVTAGALPGIKDLDVVVKWNQSASSKTNQVRVVSILN